MNRSKDWFLQARSDLEHARKSLDIGDYDWACFAAQQAAEKAAKALHMKLHQVAWGHSVFDLLHELPEELPAPESLLEKAKSLDRHYIPPRYPDAHPAGPSYRSYTRKDAEQAVSAATEVVEWCEGAGMES